MVGCFCACIGWLDGCTYGPTDTHGGARDGTRTDRHGITNGSIAFTQTNFRFACVWSSCDPLEKRTVRNSNCQEGLRVGVLLEW